MTPLFFQDEVFLDCSKDLDTSECTFTFKGKEIHLKHTIEIKPKQRVHRMTCKVDGQTFNFGAGRSTLGGGTFGTWPIIEIELIKYSFKICWSDGNGFKGIRLVPEEDYLLKRYGLGTLDQNKRILDEAKAYEKPLKKQKELNQEELDDVEGFLHIHTLPEERRKQVIEQLKNKKK